MDVLGLLRFRSLLLILLVPTLTGCQIGYLMKSAKNHLSMMSQRVPIDEAINDPKISEEHKKKLIVAKEAHEFAVSNLHLKKSENYTTFVLLDRPYVSWVVSAAPKWKLEHHQWSYPIVGKMPYKGFAAEDDAEEEKKKLEKDNLDVFLRGVSAYSTLGWFKDSILSSMLSSKEHDLANTIIHETVHATLYIRNSADFNERLAVFVGNRGVEDFYRFREGQKSPTVQLIGEENADDEVFSAFIGPQIQALKDWYESLPESERMEDLRQAKFKAIQTEFTEKILPKMKTSSYKRFPEISLSNARLMYYRTYMQDLRDFEVLHDLVAGDWIKFIQCVKTLENSRKPEEDLKTLNLKLGTGLSESQKVATAAALQETCQSSKAQ
jgi:predicted aminopeptidase